MYLAGKDTCQIFVTTIRMLKDNDYYFVTTFIPFQMQAVMHERH